MLDDQSGMEVHRHEDDSKNVPRPDEKKKIHHRRLLMVCCSLYTFLFVGSFFGWGPMQLLLEENGSFSWKCKDAQPGDEPCADQTAALLSVSLAAQTTGIISPLLGLLADRKGAKHSVLLMTGVLWSGLGLLAINAAHPSVLTDRLLYVAFSLLAIAAWSGGLLTIQAGLYWQGHTKSRVIFTLNSLFDAGGLIYLLLWFLGSELGLGFFNVMIGFLALSLIIMSLSVYLWTVACPEEELDEEMKGEREDQNQKDELQDRDDGKEEDPDSRDQSQNGNSEGWVSSSVIEQSSQRQTQTIELDENSAYVILAERTTQEQLTSPHFLLLCTFFAIHCGSNIWNLTTQRDFLAYLGDDQVGNKYLTIFTLLTPVSILGLPFVDRAILQFGFSGGLQCINLLALGYNVVKLSSTNLNVQIIGFVIFSFYRCFLFGITFSFLPTMIGQKLVGKATGFMYSIGAIATLLNIPLSQVAVKSLDGNFFIPNLIVTLLMAPCVYVVFLLNRLMKKENGIRQRRKELSAVERLRQSYGRFLLNDK